MIEPVGIDERTARQLLLVRLDSLDDLLPDALPAGHAIVFVAASTFAVGEAAIHRFAASLLDAGAVFVCCWGPGCERLARLIDDAILFRQSPVAESAVILTSSHADESLEEALAFALREASPSEDYIDSCRALLAICVGDPRWADTIRSAFRDPDTFLDGLRSL